MDLVPIKVKIGLRLNGHADHPDWTKLSMISTDAEMRLQAPQGWIYDKSCGHADNRADGDEWDSPVGMQWGCLLATRDFVNEAVVAYPALITEINEATFQDFYDNKAMLHIPENKTDVQLIQGLQAELSLRESLNQVPEVVVLKIKIGKAIDPLDNTEPGIKKNKNKTWTEFKADRGIIIA